MLEKLTRKIHGKSHRQSSWDRTGGNQDYVRIESGEEKTIFDVQGPAEINHIWCTFASEAPYAFRSIVIRMYWEEEDSPSVEVPIGDFFGVGHGVASHYISLPLNMITRQGAPQSFAAMNSFFHMPFARRGRITIGNDTGMVIPNFYYYIDYRSLDSFFEDGLHFHAMWHRENPTDGVLHMEQLGQTQKTFRGPIEKVSSMKNLNGQGNYVILDAIGAGHYIGCNLSIDHINPVPNVTWFGEGDDMIFIDGESWPPSMHGTGTEDYFCTAWDFPSGKFSGPYHGISLAEPYRTPDVWETPGTWGAGSFGYSGKWTAYRFHIEDPIIFNRSILVTIEHGHANSLSNDYASTAYWYQTEPHKQFRPLPVAAARMPLTTKESLKSYCRSI